MIRSIVTLSALGFALALTGCTAGEATNQQAPRPVPAPVVAPAPAAQQPQQAPNSSEQWIRKQSPQLQQMYDNTRQQQKSNLDQINKRLPSNMPKVPTVMYGEPGYEQQMNAYRQQVNEYMCAEGNAYTIPSNQRSC